MSYRESFEKYREIGPIYRYDSIKQIEILPVGISKIQYGAGYLYVAYVDNGAKQTVVSFHAAVGTEGVSKPVFTGINMLDRLRVNQIFVSDPILDRGINLGWFAGDYEGLLQQDLSLLLARHFRNRDGENPPIFFGASGGGFAALHYGSRAPGSLVICVNPQTNINRYWTGAVDRYRDVAWRGAPLEATPVEFDMTETFATESETTVLYLQNLGDRFHVDNHLVPLLEKLELPNRQFGLVLGKWGDGHRAPNRGVLDEVMDLAVAARGEWINLTFSRKIENRCPGTEVMRRSREYRQTLG